MPTADDFAFLNDAFAQWKSKVRTQIFNGKDAISPSEQRYAEPIGLYGDPKTLADEFRSARNPYPFAHVHDVILRTQYFAWPHRVSPQSGSILKTEVKNRIAKRMQGIHGEAAFETLARATELERQGRKIIHLEIGEPDFDTPAPVVQAGINALKNGMTHYAPVAGVFELREAIAHRLAEKHKVAVDPRNVLVSPGAKVMIFAIIHSLVDPAMR